MNGHAKALTHLILFVLFVWISRQFFGFMEFDSCLDDGGAVRNGVCIESRHGQWALASERPFLAWLIALGIPGLIAWTIYFYALRARRNKP